MKNEFHITFDSITELQRWIDNTPRSPKCPGTSSVNRPPEQDWDLCTSFDAAMHIARSGGNWETGASRMMAVHETMVTLKSNGRVLDQDYDVAGFMPDVPAYLSGDPACMLSQGEDDYQQAPIVRVGVHIGRASEVDAETAVNRGAAILSIIDELENEGCRVELTALWRNEGEGGHVDCRVIIKQSHEHWSPAAAAFALAHPAFSRRLMFAVAERSGKASRIAFGYGSEWYGAEKDFDIYFERQSSNSDFRTAKRALETVTQKVKYSMEKKDAA